MSANSRHLDRIMHFKKSSTRPRMMIGKESKTLSLNGILPKTRGIFREDYSAFA